MDDHCTCGAALPEGARFCHKCGKPQFEMPVPEPEEAVELLPEPAPAEQVRPPIGFQNAVAVRVGIMAAATISMLLLVPMPPLISAVWQMVMLFAGGFFSVFLYMRRTGEPLTVGGGARMGWMTGLFCFVLVLVFTVLGLALASADTLSAFYEELQNQAATPEVAEQLNEFLSSRSGIALLFAGIVVMMFLMLTLLPAIGGALGAKVLEKE